MKIVEVSRIKKGDDLSDLFGKFKTEKSPQELKDEGRDIENLSMKAFGSLKGEKINSQKAKNDLRKGWN